MFRNKQSGFSVVELMVAAILFSLIVLTLMNTYMSVRQEYALARQLNEVYTVITACPEVDRALEFDIISSTTNCYPNNSFPREDGGGGTINYSPNLSVTSTSSLPSSDPLYNVPNSKVLDITVGLQPPFNNTSPIELRLLITRNGIAQS